MARAKRGENSSNDHLKDKKGELIISTKMRERTERTARKIPLSSLFLLWLFCTKTFRLFRAKIAIAVMFFSYNFPIKGRENSKQKSR